MKRIALIGCLLLLAGCQNAPDAVDPVPPPTDEVVNNTGPITDGVAQVTTVLRLKVDPMTGIWTKRARFPWRATTSPCRWPRPVTICTSATRSTMS